MINWLTGSLADWPSHSGHQSWTGGPAGLWQQVLGQAGNSGGRHAGCVPLARRWYLGLYIPIVMLLKPFQQWPFATIISVVHSAQSETAPFVQMALLQRRCSDAQKQAEALANANLNSVRALLNVRQHLCSAAEAPALCYAFLKSCGVIVPVQPPLTCCIGAQA